MIDEMQLADNTEQLRAFRISARHVLSGNNQLLMYIAGVGGTAIMIHRFTMHALTMSSPIGKSKHISKFAAMSKGVDYLIVDEISMVSAVFLSQFSERLRQTRGDDPTRSKLPFGSVNVNVIFTGDFG